METGAHMYHKAIIINKYVCVHVCVNPSKWACQEVCTIFIDPL